MEKLTFWKKIEHGCNLLGLPMSLFYVWKNRGRVPNARHLDLYEALKDTEYSVSPEELKNSHT